MLKLKLQYFGHFMRRVDSLEKTLMLGGIGGRRRRGWQRMRWLVGITDSMDVSLSELQEWWWTGRPDMLPFMGSQRVGHDWATDLIRSDTCNSFALMFVALVPFFFFFFDVKVFLHCHFAHHGIVLRIPGPIPKALNLLTPLLSFAKFSFKTEWHILPVSCYEFNFSAPMPSFMFPLQSPFHCNIYNIPSHFSMYLNNN